MTITESIKFDKLQEENEILKKELAEKDKEIKNLEKEGEKLVCEKYDLQQTQLYKEDFDLTCYAECNCDGEGCGYGLKDNLKYDKLDSKDVK